MNIGTSWQRGVSDELKRTVGDGILAGALALAWHDGDMVLDEAAGHANIERGLLMSRDAIFQVASMTKPILSVAVLQLVDEGKLRLDAPIAQWMPEFATLRVLDDPAGPLERSHAAATAITVDHLLTHRAGFGYAFSESGPIASALDRTVGNVLHTDLAPDDLLAALGRLPLICEPGARFVYGHSSDILGYLLARIDGGTLGESLKRRVLEPLGMGDTDFHVPPAKLPRLARMYRRTATGFDDVTDVPTIAPVFESGSGGLYSTAGDYLVFVRMLLGNGEVDGSRVLSEAMCTAMTRNHLTNDQRRCGGLGQQDFFAHSGFGYGVQVVIGPSPPLFAAAGTTNWGGIFGTGWRLDPRRRLITMTFAQDFADNSSGPDRRDPAEPAPAATMRAAIEQMAFGAYPSQ